DKRYCSAFLHALRGRSRSHFNSVLVNSVRSKILRVIAITSVPYFKKIVGLENHISPAIEDHQFKLFCVNIRSVHVEDIIHPVIVRSKRTRNKYLENIMNDDRTS